MTATAVALISNRADMPDAGNRPRRRRWRRDAPAEGFSSTAGLLSPLGRSRSLCGDTAGAAVPVSGRGVIGGAVIRAARRSAGLSLRGLARRMSVSPAEVSSWEDGATPLFCMPYPQIRDLADTLTRAGATGGCEFAGLLLASQCDLLVTGMLHGFEDYAEVPPVDAGPEGEPARGLLRWALTGTVPQQYTAYAMPGPLLARADVVRFEAIARSLQEGSNGGDLTSLGQALIDLVQP